MKIIYGSIQANEQVLHDKRIAQMEQFEQAINDAFAPIDINVSGKFVANVIIEILENHHSFGEYVLSHDWHEEFIATLFYNWHGMEPEKSIALRHMFDGIQKVYHDTLSRLENNARGEPDKPINPKYGDSDKPF